MLLRALLLVALMFTFLPRAEAQTAEEAFARGQKAFEAEKFEESLELFRQALESSGSPNARLYVARSLAKLGKRAEAYEEMKTTVRDATERATKEPRYAETRDAAAAELALLEPKVGKLVIALADEALKPDIQVNGAPFTAVGVPTAIEPGAVVIEANADGMKPIERRIELPPGETRTVTLTFEAATAQEGPEPEPEESESGEFGIIRAAGIAVAILGVGGLVTFGVTGAMAGDKHKQLEEECGGVRCSDPTYADVVDEGKTLQTVANVMAGVGGGLLAAGVLMIIFGGPDDEESAWSPTIDVGPAGASLGINARF